MRKDGKVFMMVAMADPTPAESSIPSSVANQLVGDTNIRLLMDVPMKVSVELGESQLFVKDILELSSGAVIPLNRGVGEPVDLLVNGCLVAKGEVVVVDDNFGFRIVDFVSDTPPVAQ